MTAAEAYKKQETVLILLNIAVIAALFFIHIVFISLLGRPTNSLLTVLAARFLILVIELVWVQRIDASTTASATELHSYISIILNVSFAFMAATFSGVPDSHYSVLMIIPIISAAFRLNLPLTLAVTGVSICLTFLEIWIYYRSNPPTDVTEYFEAATVCLIYLSVAVVLWLLVGNLRAEEQKLEESLEDLRQLQAKLVMEEKLAAVGQLSSAIAHEIRNPVTMIASSLRLAEGYAPGTPIRNEMFGIAAAESKRLEQLTTDFLAFARVREPEFKPTVACDLLRYIAGLAKARLMEKNQEINVACTKRIEWNLDPIFMEQAMLNLVTNAIEATPAGGSVGMGALMEGGDLVFYVENPGPRIDDKVAAHMFEPFFTHGARGTGLGLSIVRKIAHSHSGEVYLADNQEGCVRFEIRLRGEEAVV